MVYLQIKPNNHKKKFFKGELKEKLCELYWIPEKKKEALT